MNQPQPHPAQEYKRTCQQCGKVWHSLVEREKQIQAQMKSSGCQMCANTCGDRAATAQYERNIHSQQSEVSRLKSCPNCQSRNYVEEIITFTQPGS